MTLPDWITFHNLDVIAVVLAPLAVVAIERIRDRRLTADRRHSQSLAAERGITTNRGGFRNV